MTTESFDQLVAAGEPPQPGQPPALATTAVEKPKMVLTSASELMVKDMACWACLVASSTMFPNASRYAA